MEVVARLRFTAPAAFASLAAAVGLLGLPGLLRAAGSAGSQRHLSVFRGGRAPYFWSQTASLSQGFELEAWTYTYSFLQTLTHFFVGTQLLAVFPPQLCRGQGDRQAPSPDNDLLGTSEGNCSMVHRLVSHGLTIRERREGLTRLAGRGHNAGRRGDSSNRLCRGLLLLLCRHGKLVSGCR